MALTNRAVCIDCGASPVADPTRRVCDDCEARRRDAAFWEAMGPALARHASIVGPQFAAHTLADFPAEQADRAVEDFRQHQAGETPLYGVLLVGDVGPGKTSFAAALARLWVLRGATVRWVLMRQLRRQVQDTYSDRGASESDVIEPLIGADLLVLDDLGRESTASEHLLAVLHELLDERIRWHRPTIITTNMGGAEIDERYKAAIASRLSLYDVIVLDGSDRRRGAR